MALRRQSQTQIGLQDLLPLVGALVNEIFVNLVHGTLLRILALLDQVLDPAVLLKLLPVVVVVEHLIHCDSYFATRLANHARMVILSSTEHVTQRLLLTSNCSRFSTLLDRFPIGHLLGVFCPLL